MRMDRDGQSCAPPGGSPPPGIVKEADTANDRRRNFYVVAENHQNGFEMSSHPDAAVMRLARSTMELHTAEAEAWDALADREEQADHIGEPTWIAPGWQAERAELRRRARDLGRQLDASATALATVAAVTSYGLAAKAFVLQARSEVEAEGPVGGMLELRRSTLRDMLAIEAATIDGARADG